MINIMKAIQELRPGAECRIYGDTYSGIIWDDIKFRTHMGSLYITIPTYYPHMYPIASVNEKGEVVTV